MDNAADLIRKNYSTEENGNLGTTVQVRFESLRDSIEKAIKENGKETKAALDTLEMARACLDQIREGLEAKGISMEQCPPMFYPEAIHNLAIWTAKASRDCWRDHQWHNEDLKAVGACMAAGVKRYGAEAQERFKDKAKKDKAP